MKRDSCLVTSVGDLAQLMFNDCSIFAAFLRRNGSHSHRLTFSPPPSLGKIKALMTLNFVMLLLLL